MFLLRAAQNLKLNSTQHGRTAWAVGLGGPRALGAPKSGLVGNPPLGVGCPKGQKTGIEGSDMVSFGDTLERAGVPRGGPKMAKNIFRFFSMDSVNIRSKSL
jgi:hypothetical protein